MVVKRTLDQDFCKRKMIKNIAIKNPELKSRSG